jgi:hypothetical protein
MPARGHSGHQKICTGLESSLSLHLFWCTGPTDCWEWGCNSDNECVQNPALGTKVCPIVRGTSTFLFRVTASSSSLSTHKRIRSESISRASGRGTSTFLFHVTITSRSSTHCISGHKSVSRAIGRRTSTFLFHVTVSSSRSTHLRIRLESIIRLTVCRPKNGGCEVKEKCTGFSSDWST